MLSDAEYKRELRELLVKDFDIGDVVHIPTLDGGQIVSEVLEVDPRGRVRLSDVGWWDLALMGPRSTREAA